METQTLTILSCLATASSAPAQKQIMKIEGTTNYIGSPQFGAVVSNVGDRSLAVARFYIQTLFYWSGACAPPPLRAGACDRLIVVISTP